MAHIHASKQVDEDASKGLEGVGDDFKNAHPLWNAEVLLILQHHAKRSEESHSKQTPATQALFTQTLNYVRSLNNYHSQEAVQEAMSIVDKYPAISRWELTMMNNLRIDDFEECITLIPTLKKKLEASEYDGVEPDKVVDKEMIEKILADLKRYQTTT